MLDARGGALGAGEAPVASLARPSPRAWYFVDLNGSFCQPVGGIGRCPPAVAQTDHKALAKLLDDVRAQDPRLVVVDVRLVQSSDDQGDGALRRTLQGPGPPVLLSWFPDNGRADAATLGAENDRLLFDMDPAHASPHVRYLPAIKNMDGATARYLTPNRKVALRDRTRDLPTIAYGAALVLASPPERAFARVDAFGDASPTCGIREPANCGDYALTERIFSFPRRAPHEDAAYAGSHNDPYFARIATVAEAKPGARTVGDLTDAVVVIGNSDVAAGDQSWTALGDASGAELVLNDIRQYLVDPPNPEKGFWTQFFASAYKELPFYGLSSLAIFLAALLVDWRWPVRKPVPPSGNRHLLRAVAKLALATILSCLSYGALFSLNHRPLVDVVSPFFGSLVQAVIEALYQVKRSLDALVLWFFGKIDIVRSAKHIPTGD